MAAVSSDAGTVRRGASVEKRADVNVAWVPERPLEHPEWVKWGRRFGAMGRVSNWWMGDWIQYGAARWGEKYTEAARITGYDVKTLRNIAYVAKRFDLSRRRDNLTWTHHAEVAALTPEQQDEWLDRAVVLRLSPGDLRLEVRASQRTLTSETNEKVAGESTNHFSCPQCGAAIALSDLRSSSPPS
jgi:predicted RNA-binding Zn-ribbon protein involved in translation (DUF1610 family)